MSKIILYILFIRYNVEDKCLFPSWPLEILSKIESTENPRTMTVAKMSSLSFSVLTLQAADSSVNNHLTYSAPSMLYRTSPLQRVIIPGNCFPEKNLALLEDYLLE